MQKMRFLVQCNCTIIICRSSWQNAMVCWDSWFSRIHLNSTTIPNATCAVTLLRMLFFTFHLAETLSLRVSQRSVRDKELHILSFCSISCMLAQIRQFYYESLTLWIFISWIIYVTCYVFITWLTLMNWLIFVNW